MEEATNSIGYYRGPLDAVLAAIEAARLEGALIELDGDDPELSKLVDEACAGYPELIAENELWRHGRRRIGPITFYGADDPSATVMPIEGDNLARVRALLANTDEPAIAFHVNVRDDRGYLIEAPDVGDNEIWLSERVPPGAVQAICATLGERLEPQIGEVDFQRLHDALAHDLAAAGSRYTAVRTGESGGRCEIRVDDRCDLWFASARIRDPDDLQALLDEVQDVVMETETEPWPLCPSHYHSLEPWPDRDWIVWRCPTSEEPVATFGQLGAPT
jgi:hypothetical protein